MCQFVSWIEYKGKEYFLINADLETKAGEKLLKPEVIADLCGHGAILSYYPELKGKGENGECSNFSKQSNFPKAIAKAIKQGKMSRIDICLDVLNDKGKKQYHKINDQAWAEYHKINDPALAEYNKISDPAWAEYEKISDPALAEYNKITYQAWAEYEKISDQVLAEYEKITYQAWAEYNKIREQALAEYNKIRDQAFSRIVKQEKYRNKDWK
jgi:vacuolar-type H+-ATPase subunit E/Vma4